MDRRHDDLRRILAGAGESLVAFSGGVDSTLLLKVAHDVLRDRVTAVTAVSASLPRAEREAAASLTRLIGARHLEVETREIDDPRYVRNDGRRCYFCKAELFRVLGAVAAAGAGRSILYGAVVDDLGDERPGMEAAAEYGARAPLLEAGLTKAMVRELSRRLGLPTWDKPAMACLASRLPTSLPVTEPALRRVESAEAALRALGYRQVRVRVRPEGGARIELDADGLRTVAAPAERDAALAAVRAAGFTEVVIDPVGYRPGGRPLPAPGP